VDLGTHSKCGVEGVGEIWFQLDSRVSLEVKDVLYVPEMKMNILPVLSLEYNGFAVLFQNEQVPIHSEGDIFDTIINIVSEREGYMGFRANL
jgi:hypothetical protein